MPQDNLKRHHQKRLDPTLRLLAMRAPIFVLLIATALLAGCTASTGAALDTAGEVGTGPAPVVVSGAGQITIVAPLPGGDGWSGVITRAILDAPRGAYTRGVVLVEWDAQSPLVEELHVYFGKPGGRVVDARGTSPIELELTPVLLGGGEYIGEAQLTDIGVSVGQEIRYTLRLD